MDGHAERDFPQRHAIAYPWLRVGARHQAVAGLEAFGRQDVGLHAVLVMQKGDASRAVRIVLDRLDGRPDIVLAPLEVDDAVALLVAAATETHADDALVIAPALLGLGLEQRLFGLALAVGDFREVAHRAAAPSGSRRLVVSDSHRLVLLEELDLVFGVQLDDGLLPIRELAELEAIAPAFAEPQLRANGKDA